MNVISLLFIIFGLYAIIFPNGLVNDMLKSYNVPDLIRGWGIYSVTLGLVLYFPKHIKNILLLCFTVSIFWHICIAKRTGYTNHHIESIIINIIVIIILFFSKNFVIDFVY